MIYISSITFQENYKDYLHEFESSEYGIEFSSGGLKHDENNWSILEKFKGLKIIHNYFPGYKKPFVLNLSSINKEIKEKSIKHCINCIDKTNLFSNENFFAVHAGFKLDLKVSDLGNPIAQKYLDNTAKYDKSFDESIKLLIDYGLMKNVDLLIENNVLIKDNYNGQKIPFHLVESSNIIEIFEKFKDYKNIGLLFDTAHFKVSCQTLGLDIEKEFQKIKMYIKAIHHSDNDGNYDTNSELKNDYWFLKHMKYFKHIPHVLEVKSISIPKIYQQIKLLEL